MSQPVAFATVAQFRAWLERHHADRDELDMRLFKKHASHRGIGYTEALDEALCFGWIDGVRRAFDADSFRQRFTPRRKGSRWSRVNLGHIRRLKREGRMHAAGLAALAARDPKDDRRYSFESRPMKLSPELARRFREHAAAWKYFEACTPGYRRLCCFYVMSAKQPETRLRRLERLIRASDRGESVSALLSPGKKAASTRPRPRGARR